MNRIRAAAQQARREARTAGQVGGHPRRRRTVGGSAQIPPRPAWPTSHVRRERRPALPQPPTVTGTGPLPARPVVATAARAVRAGRSTRPTAATPPPAIPPPATPPPATPPPAIPEVRPDPTLAAEPTPTPDSWTSALDGAPLLPAGSEAPAAPAPRRRALVLAAVAVVLLAGSGTAAGVALSRSPDPAPAPAAASTPDVTAVSSWLHAELPSAATVTTDDPGLVTELQLRSIAATFRARTDAPVGSFVVTTGASTAPVAAGATHTLAPVARFSDPTSIWVGQVVDQPLAAFTEARANEQDTAHAAATGLLHNAAVSVPDPSTLQVLTEGRIDLRAAAFLAVLAGTEPVVVSGSTQDAAEQAAGLGVRELVVSVTDADGLKSLAAATRSPYAPTVSTPPSTAGGSAAGTVQLTWAVSAAPTT